MRLDLQPSGAADSGSKRHRPLGSAGAGAALAAALAGNLLIAQLLAGTRTADELTRAYLGHAWDLAIVLIFLVVIGARIPLGSLSPRVLKPWYRTWLAFATVVAALTASMPHPTGARGATTGINSLHGGTGAIAATLIFQGLFVGATEELLFRGIIQTALNNALGGHSSKRVPRPGTILAALTFAVVHLTDLTRQRPSVVGGEVVFALIFGLIVGHRYDQTGNLWGAAILHNLVDLASLI